MRFLSAILLAAVTIAPPLISAQAPPAFEVVSIKRNTSGSDAAGIRTLPDGTFQMVNQPIRSIILAASPVQTREVEGMPDWMLRERYDITAKPPAGSTAEQRQQMFRTMFADRFKLVGHVEQRERDVFDMVMARPDRRMGPLLTPSVLECARQANTPPPPATGALTLEQRRTRCGLSLAPGSAVSGGVTMDTFALTLSSRAGALVMNKTGLPGYWAVELTFANGPGDTAPEFFTALQEQLGIRLDKTRAMLPVFVIDSIERPSEN